MMQDNEKNRDFQKLLHSYHNFVSYNNQETAVELLRETQKIFGFIPEHTIDPIAETASVSSFFLRLLIKRFPTLQSAPFQNRITICTGSRCAKAGSEKLLAFLKQEYHLLPGEISEDGKFLLSVQNCFKKCGQAPNVRINDQIYGRVTCEKLRSLINNLPL